MGDLQKYDDVDLWSKCAESCLVWLTVLPSFIAYCIISIRMTEVGHH